jgi:hypothetical protein
MHHAHAGHAGGRLALYAAVAIAILALIVAAYAVATMPKPYQPPPTASETVKLADKVVVDYAGVHHVNLGWIYVDKAPCVAELKANYTYTWFLLDGVQYGNPATAILAPGNHTVSAIIAAYANGTKIKVEYRIVG